MNHVRSLTGVRLIAAMWVVGFHFRELASSICPSISVLAPILDKGYLAVPFFFLLSGFILFHVYSDVYSRQQHGQFVWLRVARLWPLHAVMILVLIVYVGLGSLVRGHYVAESSYRFADLPLELLMVRSWGSKELLWNFPAWSIHCEWFAYLFLYPMCHAIAGYIKSAVAAIAAVGILLLAHASLPPVLPGQLGAIAFLFPAGAMLYVLRKQLPNADGAMLTNTGAVLFVLAVVASRDGVFLASFVLLILGLSYERGVINRAVASSLFVFGGTISYSIYMTHEVVHKFANEMLHRVDLSHEVRGAWLLALLVAGVLVAAIAAHFGVERPAGRLMREYASGRFDSIGHGQTRGST